MKCGRIGVRRAIGGCAYYSGIATGLLCKLFLIVLVLSVSWVVFGRYVLGKTPRWGEELALLLMVWFGLLSASLAIRENTHLRLSLLNFMVPERCLKYVERFVMLVMGVFAVFFVVSGVDLVELTSGSVMSGLGVSSAWLYLAVPVSGAAMLIQIVDRVVNE